MKYLIASTLLMLSAWAQATVLPEIYVTEVSTPEAPGGGGIYTVTIIQPPLEESTEWFLYAWGITNQDAVSADTLLTGWAGGLFDDTSWDSGIVFETATPGDPEFIFATGDAGVGNFDSVFGPGFSQAAVYWLEQYFGNPLLATSSNFTWSGSEPDSTAFAVISNFTSGENLACNINVGGPAALSNCVSTTVVPIPAAAWLFGSALGLLAWIRRKPA